MDDRPSPLPGKPKSTRPSIVTLLAILVLSITVLSLIRFVQAISLYDFLADIPGVSPSFLALTGGIGALLGVLLTLLIWRGNPAAPPVTRVLTLLFVVYNCLERWWLSQRTGEQSITPFQVALYLGFLIFIYWAFSLPEAQTFFGEKHE